MDIGLYMLKYPFRRIIAFLLPLFRDTNPNAISIALLPVGMVMAGVYFFALQGGPAWLFLLGIVLGFVRMIIATLDGLVAVEFNRSTALGDVVNRLTPEACDLMLLPSIVLARPEYATIGLFAIILAWATIFCGLAGAPSKCPVQSVGPVGQTDRLAALMAFSLLQFLSATYGGSTDFIRLFLGWVIGGGIITIALRIQRTVRAARELDRKAA